VPHGKGGGFFSGLRQHKDMGLWLVVSQMYLCRVFLQTQAHKVLDKGEYKYTTYKYTTYGKSNKR